MKKVFLFVFLGVFYSCGLNYDGSERDSFTGKIIDENGYPKAGVYVQSIASIDGSPPFSGGDYDVISYDYTDENGNFKMAFPSPKNENEMRLLVNYSDKYNPDDPAYSTIDFYNIQNESFINYRIDFQEIQLYPVENSVLLTLVLNDNMNGHFVGCNLQGKVAENHFNFSPFYEDENNHFYPNTENLMAPNQTVTVTYYFKNWESEEIHENSIQIEIYNEPVTYEITL